MKTPELYLDPVYQDRSFLSNLGNPNINPEVTVSYEVGLKSQLTKDWALTMTAFYNDKFDYIVSRRVEVQDATGRFVEKTFFINQDYARIRGIVFVPQEVRFPYIGCHVVLSLKDHIDDETGLPKSVVAVYTYNNQLCGRVVLIYEDDGQTVADDIYKQEKRSPYLVGNPAFAGLDIFWGLEYNSRKDQWLGGNIMDPGNDEEKEPKKYGAAIWQEGAGADDGDIWFCGMEGDG